MTTQQSIFTADSTQKNMPEMGSSSVTSVCVSTA